MVLVVQRVVLTGVLGIAAIGCNTFAHESHASVSESPWLQRCDDDSQCGQFTCLCGICSARCDTARDCRQSSRVAASCSSVPSDASDCADVASEETLCIPDCSRAACGSDPEVVVVHAPGTIPPAKVDPVARCPELAQPGDFPKLLFSTDVESYEGAATVTQISPTPRGGTTVVLVPNASVDEHFDLRFIQPPSYLTVGERLQLLVRHGGAPGSGTFDLIVVRDDAGEVLIAYSGGNDQLYASGMFATRDTLGVSIALRMTCQSPVDGGCFKNQVQAQYEGLVGADSSVVMSGPLKPTPLRIDGVPYTASFDSSSVDGGAPLPPCSPGSLPGRSLFFFMIRD